MDAVERAAYMSVGRACGFAGLAIVCVMVGLSYDPILAARTGGIFTFALTLFLIYRARISPKRPFRYTEAWLILSGSDRPSEAVAQQVIGRALQTAYFWYAYQLAIVTVALWIVVELLLILRPS